VEIKGVPKAGWAVKLVHGEAVRQVNLLTLQAELNRRGFQAPADFKIEHHDITTLVSGSQYPFFRADSWDAFVKERRRRPGFELGEGGFAVRAVKLVGLAGTLNWPTQPDHYFSHELAGRVRVIADLDQQPILVQTDRWPDYAESQRELRKIRQKLRCGPQDAVAIVWGPQADTVTAAQEITLRYEAALTGVPNETRQPFPDGSTDFERILPGPDRMYPDTDHPPIRMTRDRVERLRVALPSPPWVREEHWEGAGVPRQTVRFLIRRGGADLVDLVVRRVSADPRRACLLFGEQLKGLGRQGLAVQRIDPERWVELFAATRERPVLWEAWREIATGLARDPAATLPGVLQELGLNQPADGWERLLDQALDGPGLDSRAKDVAQALRFHMGRIMPRLRGRVPGRQVGEALLKRLQARGQGSQSSGRNRS
jgi:glutamyl-tRNA(Gln) amidotransferase subunit E